MSFTTNNNFEVPDGGVQNWDTSINENFELIEKGQTILATAGSNVDKSDVVYMSLDNKLELAISPSGATITSQFLGFSTTNIVAGIDGYVQTNGNHSHPNWAFIPGPVYLDASTPGNVTQTQPTYATLVGYAIGTMELTIKPWVQTTGSSNNPSFSVHKGGVDQTGIPTSAWTKITWPVEESDTHNYFSGDTFSPLIAGKYLFTANHDYALGSTNSIAILGLYKNGINIAQGVRGITPNNQIVGSSLSHTATAGTTDSFELWSAHTRGVDGEIRGDSIYTYWQGIRLNE